MDYDGGRGEHLKANASASNNKRVTFSPLIVVLNSEREDGCGLDLSSDSSDTVSSSSSNSSLDDLIEINPQILLRSRRENYIPQSNGSTKQLHKKEKNNATSEALYRLEESIYESPESTSLVSNVTRDCLVEHISPTLSPSIQVMEWPESLDPKQCPAPIFSRRSTPREGSYASDDSLFSITIENRSVFREDASETGVDLYKSGELPKSRELFESGELCQSGESFRSRELYHSGELSLSGELHKSRGFYQSIEYFKTRDLKRSSELNRLRKTSPTAKVIESNIKPDIAMTIGEGVYHGRTGTVDETINDVSEALMNNTVGTNIRDLKDSSSAKCQSDKTETSINTLPIKKKTSCPFCHCPAYSPGSCCCNWPRCPSKWLCCSCRWIHWRGCSFKWSIWPSSSKNCLNWQGCCCRWPSCCLKCPLWPCCKCQC